MNGKTFELNAATSDGNDDDFHSTLWDDVDVNSEDLETFANPCSSFAEKQKEMDFISEGLYKKFLVKPEPDAKEIDLKRCRVIYHRNMYTEGQNYPFDSTYLNHRTDEVCLPLNYEGVYLEGFLEALETMKEGEQSLFLISHKKMFKELGCLGRVSFLVSRYVTNKKTKICRSREKPTFSAT